MWGFENRARYDRSGLRYPSDLTEAEWAHIEPRPSEGAPLGIQRKRELSREA